MGDSVEVPGVVPSRLEDLTDVSPETADRLLNDTSARAGTTLGTSAIINGQVVVMFQSVWGVNSAGVPYYDPDGAAPGEAAIFTLRSDGAPVVIKPQGASA